MQISAQRDGQEWVFSVADNGIGISSDFLNDVFVIFHRLHTRDEYPGNGIGLAICKRIIERHGGRIWVESEKGVGTTFKFSLPANKSMEKTAHGDQRANGNQSGGTSRG